MTLKASLPFLLLDTHIWLWYVKGDTMMLSPDECRLIDVASQNNALALAAISVWEASMLITKGRIVLSVPIHTWIAQALSIPGMQLLPLTADVAIESCQLPGEIHGDPADRMIIATARLHRAQLLTHDRMLLHYAKQGWVHIS
jgi:PIN domain nuclease of toxin-antitoxin system